MRISDVETRSRERIAQGAPRARHVARRLTRHGPAAPAAGRPGDLAARSLEAHARRLAQALHDETGQLLASVYLRIAALSADLPGHRASFDELREMLDGVDDQLRRIAHELRPAVLDDFGLAPACRFLAEGVSARSDLRVQVSGSTGGRLGPEVETALYRVAQEALNNARKHAGATTVAIELGRRGHRVRLRIRDDGRGFVPERPGGGPTPERGLGLAGMRERVESIGGTYTLATSPGRGTTIDVDAPIEP